MVRCCVPSDVRTDNGPRPHAAHSDAVAGGLARVVKPMTITPRSGLAGHERRIRGKTWQLHVA